MSGERNAPVAGRRRRDRGLGGSRTPLSAEAIAAAALELVDREGFDALSMRRLAAELGAGTMTLYGYFRDRDELLDALVDLASEEIELPDPKGTWREQLRALATEIRKALERHPSAIRIRFSRPILSPGALRTTERGLAILSGAGLEPEDAARVYRTIFLYTFGFASFQPASVAADAAARGRRALAELPPEEYPHLVGAAEEATAAMSSAQQFEYGLGLILDGVEALIR